VQGRIKTSTNTSRSPDRPDQSNEITDGLRNARNVCHGCIKFKPSPDNCHIAGLVFNVAREKSIAIVVTRCGHFSAKAPPQDNR
jgi:hypothetical protein